MLGIVRVGSLVALLALGLTVAIAPPAEAKSGKSGKSGKSNRIETVLKGTESFASAKGKAKFQSENSSKPQAEPRRRGRGSDDCSASPCIEQESETEFEVEIEHIRGLAGTTLQVFVDGAPIGSMTVGSLGEASLELNSKSGDTVPAVHSGSLVEVKTPASALVASGAFR